MMTCGVFRSLLLLLVTLFSTGLVLPALCQESTISQFVERRCQNQGTSPIADPFPNSNSPMAAQKASSCNVMMQTLKPIAKIDEDATVWNKLVMAWSKSHDQLNHYRKYLSDDRKGILDWYLSKLDLLFRNKEVFKRLRPEHIQAIVDYHVSFQSDILSLTKPVPLKEQSLINRTSRSSLLSEKEKERFVAASTEFLRLVQPVVMKH